mgnify:FL=1
MFQLEKNKTKVVNTSASLAGLAVVDMGLSPMKLPDKFLAKIRRLTFSSLGSGGKGVLLWLLARRTGLSAHLIWSQ